MAQHNNAICPCGRPTHFVTGPNGEPEYAIDACERCLQEEAFLREIVAECEHVKVQRADHVWCIRCGGLQCQDGTWLHPFRSARTPSPHDLEAA